MDPIVWGGPTSIFAPGDAGTDDHRVMDGGDLVDVDLVLLGLNGIWGRSSQSTTLLRC
jgi:hypothetical protein